MNFKKILALMLALIMTFTLAGCGNTDDEQIPAVSGDQQVGDIPENQEETPAETETYPLLQIDGKEVDTDGLIMMTVNGLEIPFDEWRYMYMYCDVNGFSAGSVEYWEAHPEQFENLLAMTEQQVLESHWGQLLADPNGVTLTDEDYDLIEESLQEQRDMFDSVEEYEQTLADSAISEDLLRRLITQSVLGQRAYLDLYINEGAKFAPDDETIRKDLDENFVRVYHVLVSNDHFAEDEEYADADEDQLKEAARSYAEELLAELQGGADIYEMAQTADDPGMIDNPDGYFFTYDYMVKEFEDASFALEPNELSGIVETDYGFHIIKRLEQDDYIDEHWDAVRESYLNNLFNNDVNELLANAEITYWEDYDKLTYESVH